MYHSAQQKFLRIATITVAVTAGGALVAPAAIAAAPISQAEGRLISGQVGGTNILDAVAELRGANAEVLDPADGEDTNNQPLDASAVAGLVGLSAGSTNLFGNNGIIQLGVTAQYAEAFPDGSSAAYSGALTDVESLAGVGGMDPGEAVGDAGDSAAKVNIGTAAVLGGTDLVNLDISIGSLAAGATQGPVTEAGAGEQSGTYLVADVSIGVGGTVVDGVLGPISAALDVLAAVPGNPLDENPLADGLTISLEDLLDVAGVSDINQLPPGTNLLSYVPQAVAQKIQDIVDGYLQEVEDYANGLSPINPLRATLLTALNVARGTIVPILDGLSSTLVTPLAEAIDNLAQLDVNVQETTSDGAFSQTALRLGVGPSGSLASVDLAKATVGPNASDINAISLASGSGLIIAAVVMAIAAGGVLLIRRRNAHS